ncbi:hypothetical protein Q8F55_004315 [Vanrija albida]|uniref:6-phosphogluconate dehydrogenase NADP-binding domain-containing protein n=1 Tax=Vanrija albida TaxID=181172 RepID=A0ABR3Q6F1_9TREE
MSAPRTPALSRVESTEPAGGSAPIPFSRPPTPSLNSEAQYAFVGLGEMGKRMATNFARSLAGSSHPPLIVYNRGKEGLESFKKWAASKEVPESAYRVVTDLKEIGKTAHLIITSIGGDDAIKEVYAQLFAGQEEDATKKQTIFVDTSTTYPTVSGQLERDATAKPRRTFLAAPVFGVPRAAEKAQLIIAMAGDLFAKKVASHALVPAIGKKVMDLGSNVERAMSFKLVGNSLELGFIELISECFTLADQAGVGSEALVELIREQHSSPALVRYSERITQNKFDAEGGFNLHGGLTDSKHIRQLADTYNVPMPTMDVAHQHMITARAQGGEHMDWTALVAGQRIAAGLQPFAGKTRLEKWEE